MEGALPSVSPAAGHLSPAADRSEMDERHAPFTTDAAPVAAIAATLGDGVGFHLEEILI
jgi:hypothetical protein